MRSPLPSPVLCLLASLGCLARLSAEPAATAPPTVTVTAEKPGAVYQTHEKIVWDVQVSGDGAAPLQEAAYVLKQGGATVIGQGTLHFEQGRATLATELNEPGTVLAEVTVPGQKEIRALGGAAVEPGKIGRSAPCPEDFDAFWQAKVAELRAGPENPVLEPADSGRPGVDYWKVTLDNIRGTHIHGQLARPSGGRKAPALLILQPAGVYPLQKSWATDRAAEGWLVLNIEAHDLPIDAPPAFYDEQKKGPLNNYPSIGREDREQSYFLRMFLACVRAVDYLSERPDWDGQTLVATGSSQGGLQSFVSAGLNPKVTEIMVLVPAGCDHTGALAGRRPGWPFHLNHVEPAQAAQLQTLGYFDAVNFAARVRCPALIGLGLIDETSPPTGVFAAVNQLRGPREVVVMPNSNHAGTGGTQAPYLTREALGRAALLATGTPDVKGNPDGGLTIDPAPGPAAK